MKDAIDEQIADIVREMHRVSLKVKPPVRRWASRPPQAKQGVQRPAWAEYNDALVRLEGTMKDFLPDPSRSHLYHLPPPQLLFAAAATSNVTVSKVHNWIRIRSWCFDQIRNRDDVLMTTYQWRIALEGRYFAVDFDKDVRKLAKVTDEQINRLPSPPDLEFKRRRKEEMPTSKAYGYAQLRRLASRLEINVRFALDGGFSPYDPSERVQWGSLKLSAQDISDTHSNTIKAVAWELSVANFRLELLHLDREILPRIYRHPDPSLAARREANICYIWRNGLPRPAWEDNVDCDPLSSPLWTVRVGPIKQLASVVSLWPGGERFGTWDKNVAASSRAFDLFEYDVFSFYAHTFYRTKGQRPILPLTQPSPMAGRP